VGEATSLIVGTLLMLLVLAAGIVGAWKYRQHVMPAADHSRTEPISDEMLVALARQREAALPSSDEN
jgi:hypothetical protein